MKEEHGVIIRNNRSFIEDNMWFVLSLEVFRGYLSQRLQEILNSVQVGSLLTLSPQIYISQFCPEIIIN